MLKFFIILINLLLIISPGYSQKKLSFLLGEWKITKTVSADPSIPLTKKEKLECLDQIIIFKSHDIIGPTNPCIYHACSSVNYTFKRVNTLKYFDNDTGYLKVIGYDKKMIDIVETSCGVPFSIIRILNPNSLCIGADGYIYFLKRIKKNKKYLPGS